MANIKNYPNGDPIVRSAGSNAASVPMHVVMESTFEAGRLGSAAIADTITVLQIPADTLVTAVLLEVLTPQATVTLAVGDAGDPDGWVAAATVDAVGVRLGGGAYAAAPKLYTAATDLNLLVAVAALTTATVRVVVIGTQVA